MLYMVAARSTGDYSFVTRNYGVMTEEKAIQVVQKLNLRMDCYFSPTRFYITPVLDI